MKKIVLSLLVMFICSGIVMADYVRGYYKSNGTYVNGYNRTRANNTQMDNYSTKGNYNPYTGQMGTRNPNTYGSGFSHSNSYNNGYRTRGGYNGMY